MAKQANEQKKPDKKYDVWRMRWGFILCGLFALLLVPGSTIALAGRDNALYFSLSAIGNAPGNRLALILWTLASSGFFVYALRLLLLLCGQNNSLSEPLMCLAGGMLVVCNLLPFLPDELPRLAQYHNFLAMSASCLVALSLLVFVADLRKFDTAVCKESAGLLTLVLVSGGLPFYRRQWCVGRDLYYTRMPVFIFRIDLGGKSKRGNRHVCTNRGAICLRKEMTIG